MAEVEEREMVTRINYGSALGNDGWLEDFYNMDRLTLISKQGGKAIYRDNSGDQIVLSGSGLSYSGSSVTSGTLTAIQFLNKSGKAYLAISNTSFDASGISTLIEAKDFWNLMSGLTAGLDIIRGTNRRDDILVGTNGGNDKIYGLGGDDYIRGSPGHNYIDGGSGFDEISYTSTNWDNDGVVSGITVNIATKKIENPWGGTETFKNIEQFSGTYLKDTFLGGKGNDVFTGFKGADVIKGGKGLDEVRYHRDVDYGGKLGIKVDLAKGTIRDGFGTTDSVNSVERVYGTFFKDVFKGNSADNYFRGLSGKDSFDGRAGSDTVSFEWWETLGQKRGVVVDLRKSVGNILNDGFGNKETAKSIENIEGSRFNDKIILGKADGWAWGGAGKDTIVAGTGKNWLGGDKGADTFMFLSSKHSTASKLDTIEDFSRKQGDRIDVSRVADFDFIGRKGFSGAGDELKYKIKGGDTYVSGDIDGDKKADFFFKLDGKYGLVEGDFIL
ncbi:M10 family metallopeptidase C-terminal domain-containing protein [Shinella pollutisoli]|uniref:M10 family metallopeptidase C-terminal domain-containing protein n=1 Tax=Shinella pollutisoli TaxID=2250594 RepID=A0ABV7DJF2_9HYPH|nr:calcium-binding protein [Shinella pollutisoli]